MSASLNTYIETYFGVKDTDQLNYINQLFETKTLSKGEYLVQAGKSCNELAFVESGFLRVFVLVDGNEITQWISGPGYFGTELESFIFNSSSRWNIQALNDCVLYSISKENYKLICDTIPIWHQLEKAFLIKCFTTLENRVFTHLSMTAEERYHHFANHFPELFNIVPQNYLASMLGMTPETFSRIRRKITQ